MFGFTIYLMHLRELVRILNPKLFCNIFISTNVNRYNNCNNFMSGPVPHNKIQIKEGRESVLVLLTKGMKGYEIAKELDVDASTMSRDIQYLISQSHNYLNSLAREALP
jgi:DNA-binding NarL/FixJ family response regulator